MGKRFDNKKEGNFKYKKINLLVMIIFIVIIALIVGILYNKNNFYENDNIMNKLGKIIILPNEDPIIETIENAEGLKNESPFYANVKNKDKILIFPKATRIIIYREKENRIINVGPIVDE